MENPNKSRTKKLLIDMLVRLDAFEDSFAAKNTTQKIRVIFIVAAAATLIPGGFIAVELWAARKIVKWVAKKRRAHRPPATHSPKPSGVEPSNTKGPQF